MRSFYRQLPPFAKFLLKVVLVYTGWTLLRQAVLSPYLPIDEIVSQTILLQTAQAADILGYTFDLYSFTNNGYLDTIVLEGTRGLRIDESCDGLQIMMVFLVFVLAFPGEKKWPVGIIGLLVTHLLNVLRITGLMLIQKHLPDQFDFHHEYTLKIALYLGAIVMWFLYAKYFGNIARMGK